VQFSIKYIYIFIVSICLTSCLNKVENKKQSNDLINETSPYLLQHAYNPVNWKPWNKRTLDLAKKEDKLIIVSIGYSACHWCHVMEEESFENDSIAKIMNENFINIKVDREERPDVDKVYMDAVQLMTGSGGWPLNCITLPDGRPIFGGTYFTKEQWSKILNNISKLYKEEPKKAIEFADKLTKGIQETQLIALNENKPNFTNTEIKASVEILKQQLDTINGGFKGAPKFPMPSSIDFLLRYQYQFNDVSIERYLNKTLHKIAYGGIYDPVSGGFSRYSVDDKWHIPHFEKMLYDNAQLVSIYSKAYLVNKNDLYKNTVEETLSFIKEELTDSNGAFYSSLDADSKNSKGEKEEGAYYFWTKEELKKLIKEDFKLFQDFYNVNNYGFWEKENYVLIRNKSLEEFSEVNNLSEEVLRDKVLNWKKVLKEARKKRSKPNLDDKVLTSWNALMTQGYVDAYKSFGKEDYLNSAIKNATFLVNNQITNKGSLYRNYKEGKSTINAYLEDYALVIQSFISLYEVTFNEEWLNKSKQLTEYVFVNFFDKNTQMFYFTSKEDDNLIVKKYEIVDGVIPSSNSILANSLFKLGHYFSETKYVKTSEQMLNNLQEDIKKYPENYTNWLNITINYTRPFYEIVVAGNNAEEINKKLISFYLPNTIIAGTKKENSSIPLLSYKYNEDKTLIYVCVNGTCKLPQKEVGIALKTINK
jgi:uncharacterized protein YyaL (SSP411 family)